jgi:hypothetical protein
MSRIEAVAITIEIHRQKQPIDRYVMKCQGCSWQGFDHPKHVAQQIIAAIKATESITTVEALHALPIPTPDHLSGVLIKSVCLVDPENGNYGLGEVYERNTDGTWCMLQDPSGADWGERQVPSEDIPLPAIVLWVPRG